MSALLLLVLLLAGCAQPPALGTLTNESVTKKHRLSGTVTGEADTEEHRAICATMRGWATGNIIDMRTGLIVYRCPRD